MENIHENVEGKYKALEAIKDRSFQKFESPQKRNQVYDWKVKDKDCRIWEKTKGTQGMANSNW